MIDKTPTLNAEKNLFNSVLCRTVFKNYDCEIQRIIATYIQDEEIKNIMQSFGLTEKDFINAYKNLLENLKYSDLLFVEETPCLFATAFLLDLGNIISLGNRLNYYLKENSDKNDLLAENIPVIADNFFYQQSIRQNIVSAEYFCRNGIVKNLKK